LPQVAQSSRQQVGNWSSASQQADISEGKGNRAAGERLIRASLRASKVTRTGGIFPKIGLGVVGERFFSHLSKK